MSSKQRVAITGATGLVGGEILRRHLLETDFDIICFVRAQDQNHADQRILDVLKGMDLDSDYSQRITAVVSDITYKNFKVPEAELKAHFENVIRIFHCAAYTYFTRVNICYQTNVWSIRHLIRLMEEYAPQTNLIYFGSVTSSGIVEDDVIYESDFPDRTREHLFPYTKSKMQAEYLLLTSSLANRTLVLKPSMCFPDIGRRPDLAYDAVWALNIACKAKMIPIDFETKMETVPISLVGAASMALAERVAFGNFHISSGVSHVPTWADYVACCRKVTGSNDIMNSCTDEDWTTYIQSVPKAFRKNLMAISGYFPLVNQGTVYSSEKTLSVWDEYYNHFKTIDEFLPRLLELAKKVSDRGVAPEAM